MSSPDPDKAIFFWSEFLPTALCTVCALVIALLGLFAALVQLLANMNLHFGDTIHILIFGVGWLTVPTCAYSAYRLLGHPGYKSLWFALLAAGMLALDFWLYSLPSAAHLMH